MQRSNVYAGAKEQILKGFSNMPDILQAYPQVFRMPRCLQMTSKAFSF